jgi:hypothetical protein
MHRTFFVIASKSCFLYYQYYRSFPRDTIENQNYSKTKLTMPVLALAASYYPVFGGNISIPGLIYGMKILAQDVRAVIVLLLF